MGNGILYHYSFRQVTKAFIFLLSQEKVYGLCKVKKNESFFLLSFTAGLNQLEIKD